VLLTLSGLMGPAAHAMLGTSATGLTFEPGDMLSYSCTPADPNKNGFTFPGIMILQSVEGAASSQTFLADVGSRGLLADEHKTFGAKFKFGNLAGREVGPPYLD